MNVGLVAVRALVILILLYLLSLGGAITFPLLAIITGFSTVGFFNFILFLLAIFVFAFIGSTIGKGIRSYKSPLIALLLAYASSLAIGGLILLLGLLSIPNAPTINVNWLGTTLISHVLTVILIGTFIMVAFLVGE
jgi:hypothetical protein